MFDELLLRAYGLIVKTTVVPQQPGVSSRVFFVKLTDGRRLVVKESNWHANFARDPSAVLEKVYSLAAVIQSSGVPLQAAIKNKNGQFVTKDADRLLVVLDYIEGRTFSGRLEEFAAAGGALGKWHRAGQKVGNVGDIPVDKPYEESRQLYLKDFRSQILAEHHCQLPEVCEMLRRHIDLLDQRLGEIDRTFKSNSPRTVSILHNDFNKENGLYRNDGSFVVFLDVDQLSGGPVVWDLGNTISSLLDSMPKKTSQKNYRLAVEYFLLTYHREFPLLSAEYLLILVAALRWDTMRILRSLRRHHFENNKLPALTRKIKDCLLDRLEKNPQRLSFITLEWLERLLT